MANKYSRKSTGVLVVIAFLVGLGLGQLNLNPFTAKATPAPANDNRPPSTAVRYYQKTAPIVGRNGANYNMTEYFKVYEFAEKLKDEFFSQETGKLVQTAYYSDYIHWPLISKYINADGTMVEYLEFKNFNKQTGCPESGILINNRGRDRKDVVYEMREVKRTQQQPQKQQRQSDEFDQFWEDLLR